MCLAYSCPEWAKGQFPLLSLLGCDRGLAVLKVDTWPEATVADKEVSVTLNALSA